MIFILDGRRRGLPNRHMGCDKQKEKGEEGHELCKLRPSYSKNCKLRTGNANSLVLSILMKEILPILEFLLEIDNNIFLLLANNVP